MGVEEGKPKRKFAKSFRDLEVYQNALGLAVEIHRLCKGFPPEERYVLSEQMRRSSRSVSGNISEAWRKRRYKAACVSKLSDAETEAGAMPCWRDMALKLGCVRSEDHAAFDSRYELVISQLVTMITHADPWCRL